MKCGFRQFFPAGLALLCLGSLPPLDSAEPASPVDFVRDIRPILARSCYRCHGAKKQESGLRLTSRKSAFAAGDSGERIIVPGKPDESRLIRLVGGKIPDLRMPREGKPLAAEEIALLERWVLEGAPWPADADAPAAGSAHWGFRRPESPEPPVVKAEGKRAAWPRTAVDRFILARLESEGLAPSAEADRHTLLRRVSLDLTGLPPSPADVEAFAADTGPDAYERVVDRLLADSAYGERWARVWLDLARYADSKGYGSDPLRTIHRYRDWVIDAFNRNLPYDRFTIEQIAGDLLPGATEEQILATAFHRNTMSNDEGGTDDEEFRVAAIKDRIDTTMQVWMGFTAGCAKCHSHKYDPITQREYYQLYAFFNQTEDADRPDEQPRLATPTAEEAHRRRELERRIAEKRAELDGPRPELAQAQAAWEEEETRAQKNWEALELTEASSTDEAVFERLSDGSLLATVSTTANGPGKSGETATYTFAAETKAEGITALRLELLPHEKLPARGPGRGNGNIVLTELRLTASPLGEASSPPRPRARFVRIDLPGKGRPLSLAEVQVFSDSKNVAPLGAARQSSTDFGGDAKRAIDGNTNGEFYGALSTTHTRNENDPWWEVDLGSPVEIDRIVIWNRTDANLEARLADFRVSALDGDRRTVWKTDVAKPPRPSAEMIAGGPQAVELKDAAADVAQDGFPVEAAIDGKEEAKRGWAIGSETGRPHAAVFRTAAPLGFKGGTALRFTLVQKFGGKHTIGRLRLSATTAARPGLPLPESVAAALGRPAGERSEKEKESLDKYHRSVAPELEPLRAEVAKLDERLRAIEKGIVTTPIMRELPRDRRRKTHVLIKGNFLVRGEPVEAGVPDAFHPLPENATPNGESRDRLALARWIVDERNPLTARVAVNRLWAQLFGSGLVLTEEDFGTQGTKPSHPELLDHLALEYVRLGWDTKALLRLLVTSAAYRQVSTAPADLFEKDPPNRLLGRGPRVRLEAEMVRDQALAAAGLLSRKIGGPSVYPPQPDGLWRAAFNGERTWATSVGEDRYRRGLYTFWRRTIPYPSMATFDAPSREICTVRRISTNTPLQAFVTLNDPAFVECAQALARRIVREGGETAAQRAAYGLRLCLGRPADPEPAGELAALYESELARFRTDAVAAKAMATDPLGPLPAGMDEAEAAAWTVVANVLLNHDGILTKR